VTAGAADDGRRLIETQPTYEEAVQARQFHAGLLRSLGHGADHGVSIDVLHRNEWTGRPDSFGIFVRAYDEEVERGHPAS
jgi:hypothetical protein